MYLFTAVLNFCASGLNCVPKTLPLHRLHRLAIYSHLTGWGEYAIMQLYSQAAYRL